MITVQIRKRGDVMVNKPQISELKSYTIRYCLQYLRWQNHLTQKEFSELLGCSQSSVSMWENGVCVPHGHTLEKIAELYDLPHDFFTK